MKQNKSKQNGFTLFELGVSIIIGAAVIIGVVEIVVACHFIGKFW